MEGSESARAVRLDAPLWWWLWVRLGRREEGRVWLERIAALLEPCGATASRAEALCGAGQLLRLQGPGHPDYGRADGLLVQSLTLSQALGDPARAGARP